MAINFIAQQAGRIVAHANRFLVSELRRRGVTDIVPSHGDILNYLLRHDGATSTDIAVGSHRTKPTVTVLVDKLIAAGYVERAGARRTGGRPKCGSPKRAARSNPCFTRCQKRSRKKSRGT